MCGSHEGHGGAVIELVRHELGDRQTGKGLLEHCLNGVRQQLTPNGAAPEKDRLLSVRSLGQLRHGSALALSPFDQCLGRLAIGIKAHFDRWTLDLHDPIGGLRKDLWNPNREAPRCGEDLLYRIGAGKPAGLQTLSNSLAKGFAQGVQCTWRKFFGEELDQKWRHHECGRLHHACPIIGKPSRSRES